MARKKARISTAQFDDAGTPSAVTNILNIESLDQLPVSLIPIERIDPNPYQPRLLFDPERITELSTAMQANGFLGSLVAREVEGRYQLAFGERRLRAATEAGLDRIPLHVSPFTDEQMAEVAITENVNREDLTAIEEARGYQILSEQFRYSIRNIAQRVGKSSSHVGRVMSLLRYNDVKEALEQGRIEFTQATQLVTIDDETARKQLIDQVASNQLGQAALSAAIKMVKEPKPNISTLTPDSKPEKQPALAPDIYNPTFNIKAAIRSLSGVQHSRLGDAPDTIRQDARKMLDELMQRAADIKSKLA